MHPIIVSALTNKIEAQDEMAMITSLFLTIFSPLVNQKGFLGKAVIHSQHLSQSPDYQSRFNILDGPPAHMLALTFTEMIVFSQYGKLGRYAQYQRLSQRSLGLPNQYRQSERLPGREKNSLWAPACVCQNRLFMDYPRPVYIFKSYLQFLYGR